MKSKFLYLASAMGCIIQLCSCGGTNPPSGESDPLQKDSESSESQLNDYEKVLKYMREHSVDKTGKSYLVGTDWIDGDQNYTFLFSYLLKDSTFMGSISATWTSKYYYDTVGYFNVKPPYISKGTFMGNTKISLSSSSTLPLFELSFSYEMEFGVYPKAEVGSYTVILDELKDAQSRRTFASWCGTLLESAIKQTTNMIRTAIGVQTPLW